MPWRDIIFHNFWWKVIALILGTLTWLTVSWISLRSGTITFSAPEALGVTVTSVREFVRHPIAVLAPVGDQRQFQFDPAEVHITISGESSVLKRLSWNEVRAFVDLAEIEEAPSTNRVQVYVPSGVRLDTVTPSEVRVIPYQSPPPGLVEE